MKAEYNPILDSLFDQDERKQIREEEQKLKNMEFKEKLKQLEKAYNLPLETKKKEDKTKSVFATTLSRE